MWPEVVARAINEYGSAWREGGLHSPRAGGLVFLQSQLPQQFLLAGKSDAVQAQGL